MIRKCWYPYLVRPIISRNFPVTPRSNLPLNNPIPWHKFIENSSIMHSDLRKNSTSISKVECTIKGYVQTQVAYIGHQIRPATVILLLFPSIRVEYINWHKEAWVPNCWFGNWKGSLSISTPHFIEVYVLDSSFCFTYLCPFRDVWTMVWHLDTSF